MILSLLIAVIIFVPTIAIVGISPLGEQAIGGEGTLTSWANTTVWSSYSAFGLIPMIVIFAGGGIILLIILVTVSTKIFKGGDCE